MIRLSQFVASLVAAALWLAFPARAMDVQVISVPDVGEVWLVENHNLPIVAVEIAFRDAGAAQDPADKAGLATFAAGLLDEGAGDMDAIAFRTRLEDLSIALSFEAGRDHLFGHMKTLSDNKAEAFRLLGLAVTAPRFENEAVERVRNQLLAAIAQEEQQPGSVASRSWYARAFPDHPYGRPVIGSAETVAALKAEDLRDLAASRLARGNLLIAVVGDMTPDEVRELVRNAFRGLPESARLAEIPEATPAPPPGILVIDRPVPQSTVIYGQPGIKRHDPDWYPAYVMNYVLGGGGFASRLVNEVRELRGLAYSVSSYLNPLARAGLIVGSVGTQNERAKESIDIISAEFARMREEGITVEELEGAKKYLTGSYALNFDTSPAIAAQLLAIRLENFGPDYIEKRNGYIEAVTLEQVNDVARRLLKPEALSWVVVGRPAGVTTTAP